MIKVVSDSSAADCVERLLVFVLEAQVLHELLLDEPRGSSRVGQPAVFRADQKDSFSPVLGLRLPSFYGCLRALESGLALALAADDLIPELDDGANGFAKTCFGLGPANGGSRLV
jgi:hypothetical protein